MKFGDRVTLIMITGTVCTTLLLKDFKGCNCCPEKAVPADTTAASVPPDTVRIHDTLHIKSAPQLIEREPFRLRFTDSNGDPIHPDTVKRWWNSDMTLAW